MALLDGKYAIRGGFRWSARVNPIFGTGQVKTYTFNLTADDTSYVHINLSSNNILDGSGVPVSVYIPEGTTKTLTVSAANGSLPSSE